MRVGLLVALCVAASAVGCGSGEDGAPPTGPLGAAEYAAQLGRLCERVERRAKEAEREFDRTPTGTSTTELKRYFREGSKRLVAVIVEYGEQFASAAALQPPPEYAAFGATLRAGRASVRTYVEEIERFSAAQLASSGVPGPEPDVPAVVRAAPPAAILRAAPACRKVFPLSS